MKGPLCAATNKEGKGDGKEGTHLLEATHLHAPAALTHAESLVPSNHPGPREVGYQDKPSAACCPNSRFKNSKEVGAQLKVTEGGGTDRGFG